MLATVLGNGNPLGQQTCEVSDLRELVSGVFPDGLIVKNLPSDARFGSAYTKKKNLPSGAGDVGLIPGQGPKIPHASGQLNPHGTKKTQHSQYKKINK